MNTRARMKRDTFLLNLFRFLVSVSTMLGALSPVAILAAPAPAVSQAPEFAPAEVGFVPAWATVDTVGERLLPSWMEAGALQKSALPDWYAAPPASTLAEPPACPSGRSLVRAIPFSLLSVDVSGPTVASLGSPVGAGEVYTAVIRNDSTDTAYGVYLTASHPSFFIHDGGDQLSGIASTIPLSTVVATTSAITWTPAMTLDLAPGEVITLNFKLRATCDAQSAQRMEIGVHYNAEEGAPPDEVNIAGYNITTGRGNLVLKKDPVLQNLGTPDFGQPVTWVVTVQNTGLGKLYDAVIADYGGEHLSQPSGDLNPTTTIPVLDVNEVQTFTVVGTVAACNFTNVAEGYWPCGNKVGDATVVTPLKSTTSVLFSPQAPNVAIQVSSPITFPYCDVLTKTVVVTITNTGGPGANFRLDSTFESNGALEIVPSSISADWVYNASTGVFSYTGGTPAGTMPNVSAASPVMLSFQVRPGSMPVCAAGAGDVGFTPLYEDVCNKSPFTGSPAELVYQIAQGEEPTLQISKDGPGVVASGEVFTYQVTVSGANPQHIDGAVLVTDTLPAEFELQSLGAATTGTTSVSGQEILWNFDPPDDPQTFNESLTYVVKAITTTGGVCGASQIVANGVQAVANPTCPGCPPLEVDAAVNTAIVNEEGIFPSDGVSGSFEACGPGGFEINNHYLVTGSTTINWVGAVFTEALGTPIGAGALSSTTSLNYEAGSLSVTVNGVDYTAYLTPVTTAEGQLVVDLTPLETALPAVPTQSLTLAITYTVSIPEASLNGAVEQTFHDWSQLFLPGVSDSQACAGNQSFNQVMLLTIGRGDLAVSLAPQILDKCETNPVRLTVHDNAPGRLTDHIVVTFTASTAEILSARNFAYAGSLASISPISVVTDADIGGGLGIITFTLPAAADLNGDGEITFDVDLNCTDESDWHAGIVFQSRCAISYGHGSVRDHLYREPSLILFATPLKYTVREKEVLWKFFVTNNGNLTATHVTVNNALQGLAVHGYTPDYPAGLSVSQTLPVTDSDVTFVIDALGPNEQRAVTVTADVIACDPLKVDISAEHACFGTTCSNPVATVNFETPDPYLLTNNGESADLPMCDVGEVIFTTKNASSDVSLYSLNITETLIHLTPEPGIPITVTVWDEESNLVASTTAFTPAVVSTTDQTQMIWRAADAPAEIFTWFNTLPPLHVVRIFVPVRTTCVVPKTPQSFASASAQGPCGKHLSYDENALTLKTLQPDMTLLKQGRGSSGGFGKVVYASPGETVTWRLEVDNRNTVNSYVAENVVLSDTWPVNFEFITATTAFTPQVNIAERTILWPIGDIDPKDAPLVFFITGTVVLTDGACSPSTLNAANLTYGCDYDGCTNAIVPQDTATLGSVPDLATELSPDPLSLCEGDIPITIRNEGSAAYSTALTLTLPSGYVYSHTVSSGLTPTEILTSPNAPQFKWDLIPGRVNSSPYEFEMIIRVKNSKSDGSCPVADGYPITATVGYDNHWICSNPGPWMVTETFSLDVLTPSLTVVKSPPAQTADVGEPVTWTITITNTGAGIAENVVVTDVADSGYYSLTATAGSDGTSPVISGNLITWALPSAISATNGVWSATVTAIMSNTGDNVNVVTATAACATGCESAVVSDTVHTTLLETFEKNPEIQTGTVGSLVRFTFVTSLPDSDAVYEELTLTDTLPSGLGYVASELDVTYDVDGNQGGTGTLISDTPTIDPGALASGPVVWRLGDTPGIVQLNGVITASVQDIESNYDGVRLVNNLRMTYVDDGRDYVYTDTADVDVLEPILHIGKTYVTSDGCHATFFQDNFNVDTSQNASPVGNWTRASNNVQADQGVLHLWNSGDIQNSVELSDFSMSFMARKNPGNSGDFWLIFRITGGYNQNSYRLEWTDSSLRLRKYVGSSLQTITGASAAAPIPVYWHHFEVRAQGDRIQIYVDEQLLIDVSDTSHASGFTQVRTMNGSDIDLDDVLVTRFGETGCLVGANAPVTYTLVVSNQAHLAGHDLTITDAIPADMRLVTYTLASDDPASTVIAGPASGDTGDLVWSIDQLRATAPFDPTDHQALTLTVVLAVSDAVAANTVLSNQVSLVYDAWITDTQPTTITRAYDGGSHSNAVKTIDGGMSKTVMFDPPPTATLGTLITYTLIVPAESITATLYDALVSDTVDDRLSIVDLTTAGGTGVSSGWSGQAFTATFASIPHDTQAWVTVTARISDALGAVAGDVITNVAVMTHTTATELTRTNEVSTSVGEPQLSLVKASDPPTSNTVGSGDAVTYTVTVTNWDSADGSPAYDVVITDTLSEGLRDATPADLSMTLGGVPLAPSAYSSGYDAATGAFTITLASTLGISVGGQLVITYVATVDADVGAGLDLSNHAEVTWSSLPAETEGDRDYGPEADETTVHTVLPGLVKAVVPVTATLGDVVTYTLQVPEPPITATLYTVTVTDALDGRLHLLDVMAPAGTPVWAGNMLTVTYPAIAHDQPRAITVRAVVSSPLGAAAGDVITNQATLAHATGVTESNETVLTVTEPSLMLVKASDPPTSNTVGSGDTVTYTVTVTNWDSADGSPAYDVVITDTLPEGMRDTFPLLTNISLDGALVPPSGYTGGWNAGTGVYTIALAPTLGIPVDGELVVTYVATVDADVGAGLDLSNHAEVTWSSLPAETEGDRDYGPEADETTVHTVLPGLVKAVSPVTATLGDVVTYTLQVPEPPITATVYAVTVTDALDGRLQLLDVSAPAGTPMWAGNAFTVTYPAIAHDQQRAITVRAVVSSPLGAAAGDVITNQATLAHATGVTESNETVMTVTEPALVLVKVSDPPTSNTVGAGDAVTYTVTVTNWDSADGSPAYDVVITDTLPAHVELLSPIPISMDIDGSPVAPAEFAATYAGGVLTVDLEDAVAIPVGGVLTLIYRGQVSADVPAYEDQINHAAITWSSLPGAVAGDRDYGPVTDTTNIHAGAPDLVLVKSALLPSVDAGALLTYALSVVNTGLVSATDVVITDAVPADTAYVACSPAPCGESGGVVSWTLGTLDISVTQWVTMVVGVSTPLTDGTLIANSAWVTSTEGVTDTDTVTTPVSSSPSLHLSKLSTDANGGDVRPGDVLTYTLVLSNSGNANATSVTVSDTVPAHTAYLPGSISGGDSQDDSSLPELIWMVDLLSPYTPVTLTFAVTVLTPLTDGTSIINTALVTSTEGPTDTATITDSVVASHTLEVLKVATPSPVDAGGLLTYTIVVTATGDEPVYGVVVSETIPQHTTFYTATLPHTLDGDRVRWVVGDFLAPESGLTEETSAVSLVLQVDTPLPNGTGLVNTVSVTDTEDVTHTYTLTTPVASAHDLVITKTSSAWVVAPAELVTYTLSWAVSGNETALGVTISDTVPANTTFDHCEGAPCSENGGVVTWVLGDQAPTSSGLVTLTALVDTPLLTGTQIYNGVLISDTQGVTDTDATTTTVGSAHNLAIVKSADPALAVAGETLTYTLAWDVTGNEPALDVMISDTVPQSTTYQACVGAPCAVDAGVVTWSLGTVMPPASGLVTLTVQVDAGVVSGTQLFNGVIITDSSGLTSTDTVTTPVRESVDLVISKVDDPDPVIVGTALTYTISVLNRGPSLARNVVVTDWLPSEVIFESASPSQNSGPNPLVWDGLGDLAVGERLTLTVGVRVSPTTETIFTNVVSVDSDAPDDNLDNNEDEEPTTPLIPGLELVKTVLPGLAAPSMPFTYLITITNTGQVTFSALTLTDTLPSADVHYVAGSGEPRDPDSIISSTLVWQNLGSLAPAQTLSVAFAVTVTERVTGTFVNFAEVEGVHPGGTITESDDAVISIVDPEVEVSKDLMAPGVVDGLITFTVRITNVGPSVIDVLPLYDYFTGDVAYLGGAPEADFVDNVAGILSWNDLTDDFGRDLPPGDAFTVTTVFEITTDGEYFSVRNRAVVSDVEDIFENPANEDADEEEITNQPTSVDLRYFRGTGLEQGVRLEWATAVEVDNFGFRLLRTSESGDVTRASEIAFVPSLCRGNLCGADYLYDDVTAIPGLPYWYWLVDVDTEGQETLHGPVRAQVGTTELKEKLYLPLVLAIWP